jgi:hypothetical protein
MIILVVFSALFLAAMSSAQEPPPVPVAAGSQLAD